VIAKAAKKISWVELGATCGLSDVYVSSACLGNNSLSLEDATKVTEALGLCSEVAEALAVYPMKGENLDEVSKDPLIYRFYEIAYVYGEAMKECIQEKFGDGIMSAIDFSLDIGKQEDPKGDRVVVTMNGKFLPYKKF